MTQVYDARAAAKALLEELAKVPDEMRAHYVAMALHEAYLQGATDIGVAPRPR